MAVKFAGRADSIIDGFTIVCVTSFIWEDFNWCWSLEEVLSGGFGSSMFIVKLIARVLGKLMNCAEIFHNFNCEGRLVKLEILV